MLDMVPVALAVVVGLLIGSFLNVVIHRLPLMMERQWQREAKAMLEDDGTAPAGDKSEEPAFNLCTPASRCPHCGHRIRWWQNIPLLSYALLGGKCSQCKAGIGLRYPLVELATGLLFGWCVHRFGVSVQAGAWCLFSALLLALALIDWDTTLLPDDLTYPLLWAGLLASTFGWTGVALHDSVVGAAAGYLALWSIYWVFKLLTGKEGMGYGDFKLLAALGAWFGWQALVPIALISSVVGAIIGIAMKLSSKLREGGYVPFGPFLALGGFLVMLLGTSLIDRLLHP
ncbi:MAG: prepilin peptidase [Comamonas sp.]